MRNGGTHSNVSVRWVIKRNSSEILPVTADILPESGVLQFSQGQMMATVPLTIVSDDIPEEAEAYLLQILAAQGGAELGSPTEVCILEKFFFLYFIHINVN